MKRHAQKFTKLKGDAHFQKNEPFSLTSHDTQNQPIKILFTISVVIILSASTKLLKKSS
jgi:hypothetical protein